LKIVESIEYMHREFCCSMA